jgi:hypothetical protein
LTSFLYFEKVLLLKLKSMKKLILFLALLPFLNYGQIISPCSSSDTVFCGPHAYDYTFNRTRGLWFQAKSSFKIVGVIAGDGNAQGVNATHQSIEIIQFTNGAPLAFGFTNPHTVLFSTINTPWEWISCNAQIDSGGYYAIVGAKNDSIPFDMYNTYLSGTNKLFINGDSTEIYRAGIQYAICLGTAASGQYFDDGLHTAGRIHFITETDNNPQAQINQAGQLYLDVSVLGGLAPYSFSWSTGEITQIISPQANGNYWVLITDANGCISDTAYYNVTFFPSALDDCLIDNSKRLNNIRNILGEPTKPKPNTTLFYIYDDGKVEKRIVIE